jgi:hypothetical protein
MAIRIKSERIHQLAKAVAAMTGETQVDAIKHALQEKLDEVGCRRSESRTHFSQADHTAVSGKVTR